MLIGAGPLPVPTPGTKVAVSTLTAFYDNNHLIEKVHGILFQALDGNTGKVTLYQLQSNGTTYNKMYVFGIPTTTLIPSFSIALTWSPNAVQIRDLYLDAAVANEGVLVSALIS